MAQSLLQLDPVNDVGTDLITKVNAWVPAVLSSHSGPSRPSYAEAGTFWLDTSSPTAWRLRLYDGAGDILIATIDPATNALTLPAGAVNAAALAAAAVGGPAIAAGAIVSEKIQSEQILPQHLALSMGGGLPISWAFDDAAMWTADPSGISVLDGDGTEAAPHKLAQFAGDASDAFQSLRSTVLNSPKVAVGQAVRLSAYVRSSGAPADGFRAQIVWLDAFGAQISTDWVDLTAADFASYGWANLQAIAPSGVRRAQVILSRTGTDVMGDWFLSDLKLSLVRPVSTALMQAGVSTIAADISPADVAAAIDALGSKTLWDDFTDRGMSGAVQTWTGIPSDAREVRVGFSGLSLDASGNVLLQLGDAGGYETSGYNTGAASSGADYSGAGVGFVIPTNSPSGLSYGELILRRAPNNNWHGVLGGYGSAAGGFGGGGHKRLTGPLTALRALGTSSQNFDGGTMRVTVIRGEAV